MGTVFCPGGEEPLRVQDSTNTTSYVYDTQNQLVRENNPAAGKTWTWVYDNAGNILSRNEYAYTTGTLGTPVDTVSYTYGDSSWGDLLTAYDGKPITYDTIGNPLTYDGWTFTWQHGRQLASMSKGNTTWTNTYDANGMRTMRSDGYDQGTYTYVYNGSKLSQMTVEGYTFNFTYDASGTPLSFRMDGTLFYYETNLQGDVVGITDTSGNSVVRYAYDAWGNVQIITNHQIAMLNPLLYRGYVYDWETGLYYLQSRYYNPDWGRFINADAFAATGQGLIGNNMFTYCGNNSVNNCDPLGNRYCIFSPVPDARAEDKSTANQGQGKKGNTSLRDVTDEIVAALNQAVAKANIDTQVSKLLFGDGMLEISYRYLTFYNLVNHESAWDIKRSESWTNTIKTPFPGQDTPVLFSGVTMTPECLGNFTYGFLGYAYNIPMEHLIAGSYYAADFPTSGSLLENEIYDWVYIKMGYEAAVIVFQ